MRFNPVRALVIAALGITGVVVAGGAVDNSGGTYVFRSTQVQDLGDGVKGSNTDISNKTAVVELGDIELAATGINTKTLLDTQNDPCGNTSMSWDDSPAGSAYKVTNHTSWLVGVPAIYQCNLVLNDVPNAHMWGPNGCDKVFSAGINQGQTIVDSQDCTGTASTKTQWSLVRDLNDNIRYYCGYKIPGGGGYWTLTNCSV